VLQTLGGARLIARDTLPDPAVLDRLVVAEEPRPRIQRAAEAHSSSAMPSA
jgi:hypothetical protein